MKTSQLRFFQRAGILLLTFGMALALSACGSSKEKEADVDLSAVMDEITSEYDLPDMMSVSTDENLTSFYGIDPEDVESYAIQICSTGIDADEIVLIRAVDTDAAARVEEQLEERYESKLSQMEDYLPEQYDIIKECSVETNGTYVSMIISPDAEAMTELYNSYF